MLPDEFADMVKAVRVTAKTLGEDGTSKNISEDSVFYKRSILVSQEIKKGDRLTEGNMRIARPGDGLCPSKWSEVLGKKSFNRYGYWSSS